MKIRAVILLVALSAMGCSDADVLAPVDAPRWENSAVATDSLVYTLERSGFIYSTDVTVAYRNRTGQPVHYARCGADSEGPRYGIRRADGDTTRTDISVFWGCPGGTPTGIVKPGELILVRVLIRSSESSFADQSPTTMAMRTGIFRVLLELCRNRVRSSDNCEPAPLAERASNPFRIAPPRS